MSNERVIYVVNETTRHGDETWDLGTPEDVSVSYESFYFDTGWGMLEIEDIEGQIERLEFLLKETNHPSLQDMIDTRKAWIQEQVAEQANELAANASLLKEQRKAAAELLGIASGSPLWEELVEVP